MSVKKSLRALPQGDPRLPRTASSAFARVGPEHDNRLAEGSALERSRTVRASRPKSLKEFKVQWAQVMQRLPSSAAFRLGGQRQFDGLGRRSRGLLNAGISSANGVKFGADCGCGCIKGVSPRDCNRLPIRATSIKDPRLAVRLPRPALLAR